MHPWMGEDNRNTLDPVRAPADKAFCFTPDDAASCETATVDAPQPVRTPFAETLRFETEAGTFVAGSTRAMISSARKVAYRGTLVRPDGAHLPAIAMVFVSADPSHYATEAASLARNQLLCVGPEAYELTGHVVHNGQQVPVVLEEDAGTDLEDALFAGAMIEGTPGTASRPLHSLGTRERDLENRKIFYDILDQVERLHAHGLYHRDIRAANICVRRFGPSPQDIHATLIDHELVTSYEGTDVPATAERYSRTLRQSNLDQIRDIPIKVRALGYRIVPLAEVGPDARVAAFSPEEIESLAYLEHRRWWQERLRDGWIAGFPRDDEHRIHPDLIPYDELSEQSREYDRVAARGIIGILEQLGFAVTR